MVEELRRQIQNGKWMANEQMFLAKRLYWRRSGDFQNIFFLPMPETENIFPSNLLNGMSTFKHFIRSPYFNCSYNETKNNFKILCLFVHIVHLYIRYIFIILKLMLILPSSSTKKLVISVYYLEFVFMWT